MWLALGAAPALGQDTPYFLPLGQFPDGDRGGNLFIVRADGRMTNLHKLWDDLLGGYEHMKLIQRVAERAVEDHPRDKLA